MNEFFTRSELMSPILCSSEKLDKVPNNLTFFKDLRNVFWCRGPNNFNSVSWLHKTVVRVRQRSFGCNSVFHFVRVLWNMIFLSLKIYTGHNRIIRWKHPPCNAFVVRCKGSVTYWMLPSLWNSTQISQRRPHFYLKVEQWGYSNSCFTLLK